MTDAKALAGSLAGMRPEQAQRTAQHTVDALQRDQQQQQQMLQMALGAALEKRKTDLRERELQTQEVYMQNKNEHLKMQLNKMKFEQQMMDQLGNMTIETTQGPMKGDLAMGLHSLGMPLFGKDTKVEWKVEDLDNERYVISFNPSTLEVNKIHLGKAPEDDDLRERINDSSAHILRLYNADSFFGLDPNDRMRALAADSIAHRAIRQNPEVKGNEAAGWALEQTQQYNEAYKNLVNSGTRPWTGDKQNHYDSEVVNQVIDILPHVDHFWRILGVKMDYFDPARLLRTIKSLGYSDEEAEQIFRIAEQQALGEE